jgi:CheY-like chemotaxis protein
MENIKILIVEDEKDLNDAYNLILSMAGYSVTTAMDGKEGLEDLRMPVIDGIGFLEKYNTPCHAKTSIILFSNYEVQSEVDKAFKLGIERYILKSLASPAELLRIVESTLAGKN